MYVPGTADLETRRPGHSETRVAVLQHTDPEGNRKSSSEAQEGNYDLLLVQ